MRKLRARASAAGVLLALGLAPVAQAQPVLVKLASLVPENSSWHLILKQGADRWKTLSRGQVSVRIHAGGIAGDDPEVVRKLRQGTLDASLLTTLGLAEIDKSTQALGVPMLFVSYDEAYWVLEKMRPRLESAIEARGFVVLNWADAGWVHFFTAKPVTAPDDLKQHKLFAWASNSDAVEAWRSAGFSPVTLPATELQAALQTGQVTALGVTPQLALISQYYTSARNMTDLPWQLLLGATLIRKQTWERIPPELRPALMGAARETGARLRDDVRNSAERDVEAMRKRGLNVVRVDERTRGLWIKAAQGLHPRIRGPIVPADAFDEALQWRDEYRKGRR